MGEGVDWGREEAGRGLGGRGGVGVEHSPGNQKVNTSVPRAAILRSPHFPVRQSWLWPLAAESPQVTYHPLTFLGALGDKIQPGKTIKWTGPAGEGGEARTSPEEPVQSACCGGLACV